MADTSSWVLVDDRDPGISLGPPGAVFAQGGVSQEYCQTTTGLLSGDYMMYYFNASAIGVYGTYSPTTGSGPPVAVYQVDNIPATTVTAPTTQQTEYRQSFWNVTNLPSLSPGGFHSLAVTAATPNLTVWIDYLAYPPASLPSSTTSSISSDTSLTTQPPNTPASISGAPASGGSSSNGISGATIAGVVVGASALLLAAVALFIYVRHRRSSQHILVSNDLLDDEFVSPDMSQHTPIDPFLSPSPVDTRYGRLDSYTSAEMLSPEESPKSLSRVPVRTIDGGVSVLGGPLQIPPEYQERYP